MNILTFLQQPMSLADEFQTLTIRQVKKNIFLCQDKNTVFQVYTYYPLLDLTLRHILRSLSKFTNTKPFKILYKRSNHYVPYDIQVTLNRIFLANHYKVYF